MTVAEFAKFLAPRSLPSEVEDFEHNHTLKSMAQKHAAHANTLRTGTAWDWEDLERYQEELARLEREGPGTPNSN